MSTLHGQRKVAIKVLKTKWGFRDSDKELIELFCLIELIELKIYQKL